MQDTKVRTILTRVRGMSVEDKSPVDYIDGVLETLPNGEMTVENASPMKHPILGANYGPVDKPAVASSHPLCG